MVMNYTEMAKAADYFNPVYFTRFFNDKLKLKKGGGLDGLTPTTFWKHYAKELDDIAIRCLNGTYKFSAYKEKLILKGKDKFPRVLSVPSMRDRMILGVLNQYLQEIFPEAVNTQVPNQYVKDIGDFLALHSSEKIYFFKTDIQSFYDSIDLNTLYKKIEPFVEVSVLQLIKTAINTITVSKGSSSLFSYQQPRLNGIPQGLSISNILAGISMLDFDESIESSCDGNTLYKRYVDDILILSTNPIDYRFVDEFKCELILKGVSLRLSPDKTHYGIVGDKKFEYIGYSFTSALCISIRQKNTQSFLNRISRLISRYRSQKENPFMRPRFIFEDKSFDDYYIALINLKLSGFKSLNHLYGWLPYFQAMTDIRLLYELDTVVHKKFLKGLEIEKKIKHLPKVYWDIKKHAGKNMLTDFDALTETGDIKAYLISKGLIDSTFDYSEDEIRTRYFVHLERLKKDAHMTVGTTS